MRTYGNYDWGYLRWKVKWALSIMAVVTVLGYLLVGELIVYLFNDDFQKLKKIVKEDIKRIKAWGKSLPAS